MSHAIQTSEPVGPQFQTQAIKRAIPGAFKVALRILQGWGLNNREIATVLDLSPRTLARYIKDGVSGSPSHGLVERVSYVLGIEKALEILGDSQSAKRWINEPSFATPFGGEPPRLRITSGNAADLYRTRAYLDAWRGGDFA